MLLKESIMNLETLFEVIVTYGQVHVICQPVWRNKWLKDEQMVL